MVIVWWGNVWLACGNYASDDLYIEKLRNWIEPLEMNTYFLRLSATDPYIEFRAG